MQGAGHGTIQTFPWTSHVSSEWLAYQSPGQPLWVPPAPHRPHQARLSSKLQRRAALRGAEALELLRVLGWGLGSVVDRVWGRMASVCRVGSSVGSSALREQQAAWRPGSVHVEPVSALRADQSRPGRSREPPRSRLSQCVQNARVSPRMHGRSSSAFDPYLGVLLAYVI